MKGHSALVIHEASWTAHAPEADRPVCTSGAPLGADGHSAVGRAKHAPASRTLCDRCGASGDGGRRQSGEIFSFGGAAQGATAGRRLTTEPADGSTPGRSGRRPADPAADPPDDRSDRLAPFGCGSAGRAVRLRWKSAGREFRIHQSAGERRTGREHGEHALMQMAAGATRATAERRCLRRAAAHSSGLSGW